MRKNGFYWVKVRDEKSPAIGYYRANSGWPWSLCGTDQGYKESEIEVICEVQEPPEEAVPHK
jgi:hypothetical protein